MKQKSKLNYNLRFKIFQRTISSNGWIRTHRPRDYESRELTTAPRCNIFFVQRTFSFVAPTGLEPAIPKI